MQLWHGADDATVPVGHALQHGRSIPGLRATVLEREGHFFLRAQLPRVLAALTAAWPRQDRRAAAVAAA